MTENSILRNAPSVYVQTAPPIAVVPPPKLAVRNLNFLYGDTPALTNISLEIPEKQVTAIIGPSG